MAKKAPTYICTACGARHPKWIGCCPVCNEWNCIQQEQEQQSVVTEHVRSHTAHALPLRPLTDVVPSSMHRMASGIGEFDRVLGGGIVPGAFIMFTGDPGIGKSTLLLQVAHALSVDHTVMYVSSEESLEQVSVRARRINCISDRLLFSDQPLLDAVIATAYEKKPAVLVIDSLQNCYSSESNLLPGSIGQLREATFKLMRLAKEQNIALLVTGHITKDGSMAGPKTLEHMVDVVVYVQAEEGSSQRMLRAVKNRFGTLDEVGFFEMTHDGMQELRNVNAHIIKEYQPMAGAVLASTIEGTRPVLLELQALTVPTKYGIPQRVISGCDHKQVTLICALLERHLKLPLSEQDIFFRVSGGCKMREAGSDLAIALALISAYVKKPLPQRLLAVGEVALTGHVRPVARLHTHAAEAEQFGIPLLLIADQQRYERSTTHVQRIRHIYELATLFADN